MGTSKFSLEPHEVNRNNYINYGKTVPLNMGELLPLNVSERADELLYEYTHRQEIIDISMHDPKMYNNLRLGIDIQDKNLLRQPKKFIDEIYAWMTYYVKLLHAKDYAKIDENHDAFQTYLSILDAYPRLNIQDVYKNPDALAALLEKIKSDYTEYNQLIKKRRNESKNLFNKITRKINRASLKRKNRNNSINNSMNNSMNNENENENINYGKRHKKMTLPGQAFGLRKTKRRSKK